MQVHLAQVLEHCSTSIVDLHVSSRKQCFGVIQRKPCAQQPVVGHRKTFKINPMEAAQPRELSLLPKPCPCNQVHIVKNT